MFHALAIFAGAIISVGAEKNGSFYWLILLNSSEKIKIYKYLISGEEMISKDIEGKIEEVDVLTDFDGTMIKEQSQYIEILAYFFFRNQKHIRFAKEVAKEYVDYKRNSNIQGFYSLFRGCPVEILDKIVKRLYQDGAWNELVEKLKPKKIGVVSRNNNRIISEYIQQLNYPLTKVNLVAANNPEIKNGVYTGEAQIVIDNNNLAEFIGKKEYICREEEKRIVEKSGIDCKRLKGGLYICKRGKIF